MMKTLTAAAAMLLATVGIANALPLVAVTPEKSGKIFTTEIKRDQNVQNTGRRGHDMFVRPGDSFKGSSAGIKFGDSGTSYDWSLSYDGVTAELKVDDVIRSVDAPAIGVWNAIQFYVQARDGKRFDSSSTIVSVDTVNSISLAQPVSVAAKDGVTDTAFAQFGGVAFQSIAGTFMFDFDTAAGAKGSPNSRLGFSVKALSIDPGLIPAIDQSANNVAVPVPAGALLMVPVLAAAGFVARRKTKK